MLTLNGVINDTLTMALLMLLPIALVVFVHNIMAFFLAQRIMSATLSRSVYHALGIVFIPLHELSHAVACVVFRHKIVDIRLVSIKEGLGGYVNHTWNQKSLYQRLGLFFIAIAPLLTAIALMSIGQSRGWLQLPDTRNLNLTGFYYWITNAPLITTLLFASLCFYCTPSIQDFKNSTKSIFLNALIIVLVIYVLLSFNVVNHWEVRSLTGDLMSGSIVVSFFSIGYWTFLWLVSLLNRDF